MRNELENIEQSISNSALELERQKIEALTLHQETQMNDEKSFSDCFKTSDLIHKEKKQALQKEESYLKEMEGYFREKSLQCEQALRACMDGDIETIQNFIGKDSQLKELFINLFPLHIACSANQLDVIKYLLEDLKVNPDLVNSQGEKALNVAITSGSSDVISLLKIFPNQSTALILPEFTIPQTIVPIRTTVLKFPLPPLMKARESYFIEFKERNKYTVQYEINKSICLSPQSAVGLNLLFTEPGELIITLFEGEAKLSNIKEVITRSIASGSFLKPFKQSLEVSKPYLLEFTVPISGTLIVNNDEESLIYPLTDQDSCEIVCFKPGTTKVNLQNITIKGSSKKSQESHHFEVIDPQLIKINHDNLLNKIDNRYFKEAFDLKNRIVAKHLEALANQQEILNQDKENLLKLIGKHNLKLISAWKERKAYMREVKADIERNYTKEQSEIYKQKSTISLAKIDYFKEVQAQYKELARVQHEDYLTQMRSVLQFMDELKQQEERQKKQKKKRVLKQVGIGVVGIGLHSLGIKLENGFLEDFGRNLALNVPSYSGGIPLLPILNSNGSILSMFNNQEILNMQPRTPIQFAQPVSLNQFDFKANTDKINFELRSQTPLSLLSEKNKPNFIKVTPKDLGLSKGSLKREFTQTLMHKPTNPRTQYGLRIDEDLHLEPQFFFQFLNFRSEKSTGAASFNPSNVPSIHTSAEYTNIGQNLTHTPNLLANESFLRYKPLHTMEVMIEGILHGNIIPDQPGIACVEPKPNAGLGHIFDQPNPNISLSTNTNNSLLTNPSPSLATRFNDSAKNLAINSLNAAIPVAEACLSSSNSNNQEPGLLRYAYKYVDSTLKESHRLTEKAFKPERLERIYQQHPDLRFDKYHIQDGHAFYKYVVPKDANDISIKLALNALPAGLGFLAQEGKIAYRAVNLNKWGLIAHTFSKMKGEVKPGHLSDTFLNRKEIVKAFSDPRNLVGTDKYGSKWFAEIRSDGKQRWARFSSQGVLKSGGLNEKPLEFHPEYGFCKPLKR
ncbi:MAG: hypothetical protein JWM09_81 [Francisellaceae bacterium]|nr:hypothetical protein [Francisellaceae bacterium]